LRPTPSRFLTQAFSFTTHQQRTDDGIPKITNLRFSKIQHMTCWRLKGGHMNRNYWVSDQQSFCTKQKKFHISTKHFRLQIFDQTHRIGSVFGGVAIGVRGFFCLKTDSALTSDSAFECPRINASGSCRKSGKTPFWKQQIPSFSLIGKAGTIAQHGYTDSDRLIGKRCLIYSGGRFDSVAIEPGQGDHWGMVVWCEYTNWRS